MTAVYLPFFVFGRVLTRLGSSHSRPDSRMDGKFRGTSGSGPSGPMSKT